MANIDAIDRAVSPVVINSLPSNDFEDFEIDALFLVFREYVLDS